MRSNWQLSRLHMVAVTCMTLLGASRSARAGDHVVHVGQMLDVKTGKVRKDVSIVVHDNVIQAVVPGFAAAKTGQTIIDLKKYTVLPGLIDAHVHLSAELSPSSRADAYYLSMADFAFRAFRAGRQTLDAGFTTVRDLGDRSGAVISLRNAIGKGWVTGPRIFAAGRSIASTGGHGDPTSGLSPSFMTDVGPEGGVVNSADEARQAVRQRYKEGSDLIKITATGGVLSLGRSGDNVQFNAQELAAIIATAKDYGFAVAAHAHGREGMLRAVQAGVDSIEHGSAIDAEIIRAMKARGTYLVPTLSAGVTVVNKASDPNFFSPGVRAKAQLIGPRLAAALGQAYRNGVKLAFGTDAGVGMHGENAKEFGYLVKAGVPPLAAIQSATIHAAALLRQSEHLGTLEPGKFADLIAVARNPLDDVAELERVLFVMKDGAIVKDAR